MADAREIELVFEPQEEGGFHVYAPDLPGLHTQGEDMDDAMANANEGQGWKVARQRGSHVRLKKAGHRVALVVPLHRELRKGTLGGILRDADLSTDDLRRLLAKQ